MCLLVMCKLSYVEHSYNCSLIFNMVVCVFFMYSNITTLSHNICQIFSFSILPIHLCSDVSTYDFFHRVTICSVY